MAWLVIRVLPPKEPSYKGRTLSQWLLPMMLDVRVDELVESPSRARLRADSNEALHAIGTNAIPTLLAWAQSKDTPLKLKLLSLAERLPLIRIHHISPQLKHEMAVYGFSILGKDARSAIPALIEMGHDTNQDWNWAYACLVPIDTNAANELGNDRINLEWKLGHPAPNTVPAAK